MRDVNGEVGTSYCCSPDLTTHFVGNDSRKSCSVAGDFRAISSSDFRWPSSLAKDRVSNDSAVAATAGAFPVVLPDSGEESKLEIKIPVRTMETHAAEPVARRPESGSISSKHARHAAGDGRAERFAANRL